ncbi:MAG: amino acid permease [Elusimicrobia bacterium]|nr:amino acid permease [Elusimicrobiota bacterium]
MVGKPSRRVAEVVVLSTAMLTFISFWRAAAIVLCDMASTAWYIGGIAEQAIGKGAPWFILGVMAFSACILALETESAAIFVRGGVYKVVREAMGRNLAKVSVSALMFDFTLTGAISSVAAGQYLAGLLNHAFPHLHIGWRLNPDAFSVFFAVAAVLYFWRQNIIGIEESSDKSLKIMRLVAVMGLVVFGWSLVTIWFKGFSLPPFSVSFDPHSLGWLAGTDWPRKIGAVGLLVAFGHAFLGLSGVETLVQVYREMEAPKHGNLKKACLVIFLTCFLLTAGMCFLAVGIIPDAERAKYLDNLIAGLAMHQVGPHWARLGLQAFVVGVGSLILCGAVNTAIVGSNGVLNRMAEDGVMPEWFRYLHPRYGTTHRMINMVALLQIGAVIASRGNLYLLGEAYAFGLIWSLVFNAASITALRFRRLGPREWRLPFNVRIGGTELPVGLGFILAVLLAVACVNLLTKRTATVAGIAFTVGFYALFWAAERFNRGKARGEHREKVNLRNEETVEQVLKHLDKPNRVLVAVRDPHGLHHLAKALETLDEETTELVVLYCRIHYGMSFGGDVESLGPEEEHLFTRVIEVAERSGKTVVPLMVVSNDPFYAIAQSAQAVGAGEVVLGTSGRLSLENQLERLAMTWGAMQKADQGAVTVRVVQKGGAEMVADL